MKLHGFVVWAILSTWIGVASAASPVYVGASFGLYESSNAGATWQNVNIPLNNVLLSGPIRCQALGMDPNDPSKIYVLGHATAWALFASPDAGQTWTAAPFIAMTPDGMAVDFAGEVIYVRATSPSSGDPLLYESTNLGATWTRLTLPNTDITPASQYPFGTPVRQMVPDPMVSGSIYVSSIGQEFFESTDFGTTWTQILPGFTVPQTSILNINVDPRDPLVWFIATEHTVFPQTCPVTNGGLCGLFESTDGGATSAGLSIPSNYVSSISFGATPGTVYAAADVAGLGGTVMRTIDGGSTWTPLKNGLFASQSGRVWADPADASTVYVDDTNSNHRFYVSTDGGATFPQRAIPEGPPGCTSGCQQQYVYDVLVASSVPEPDANLSDLLAVMGLFGLAMRRRRRSS
jgi:MYXO-CTERM domain-containing protein